MCTQGTHTKNANMGCSRCAQLGKGGTREKLGEARVETGLRSGRRASTNVDDYDTLEEQGRACSVGFTFVGNASSVLNESLEVACTEGCE